MFVPVPPQVIARKQESLVIEQRQTAGCVPRYRDDLHVGGGDDRGVASDQPFRFWHRLCILFVNDPRRLEVSGISRGVRDIILVAQDDVPDATPELEGFDQMRQVSGRVQQPIAMLMTNEITVGAERLLRIESVV